MLYISIIPIGLHFLIDFLILNYHFYCSGGKSKQMSLFEKSISEELQLYMDELYFRLDELFGVIGLLCRFAPRRSMRLICNDCNPKIGKWRKDGDIFSPF